MSEALVSAIVEGHRAAEPHATLARRLGVSRQYVGAVVLSKKLKPRSTILAEQRAKAKKVAAKEKARLWERRAEPHLTAAASRIASLWRNRKYSVNDIARELNTTPEFVMKTASMYRKAFPELFPRRTGGRKKDD